MGAVAIAVVMGLVQMYQSEKARGANQAVLDGLKADFDKLVPPHYNMSIMDPPKTIQTAVQSPDFDMSSITPEQFKVIGKYQPEQAAYIAEKNPELIKDTADMAEGRGAQLAALRKLKDIGGQDSDPALQQQLSEATRQAQADAQSRGQSILQQANRRGALNSGLAMSLQQQAGTDAMNREAVASQGAAAEAYKNRLAALQNSAALGGQIRSQDEGMQSRNIDIINAFNQRTANGMQNYQNQRADTLNSAQKYNLGNQQEIANKNVSQGNEAMWQNQARKNALQTQLYNMRADEQGRQNKYITDDANWNREERNNQNNLMSKSFNDQAQLAAGRNGLGVQQMSMNTQSAKDANNALQGVGNAGIAGYTSYDNRQFTAAENAKNRKARYGYDEEEET